VLLVFCSVIAALIVFYSALAALSVISTIWNADSLRQIQDMWAWSVPHATAIARVCVQGRNEGGIGATMPRAPKSPNNVASSSFNTVHLLLKDLRFEHGVAKLVSCPGLHPTAVRPLLPNSVNRLV